MSRFVPESRLPFGTVAVAVLRQMTAPLRSLVKALNNRREVANLLQADAGMLRDLGLSQTDITCALAEPMWRDPSSRLLVWSIERRAAARANARDNLRGLAADVRPQQQPAAARPCPISAPALSRV